MAATRTVRSGWPRQPASRPSISSVRARQARATSYAALQADAAATGSGCAVRLAASRACTSGASPRNDTSHAARPP